MLYETNHKYNEAVGIIDGVISYLFISRFIFTTCFYFTFIYFNFIFNVFFLKQAQFLLPSPSE